MDQQFLDRLVAAAVGKSDVAGAVLHVTSGDGRLDLTSCAGNLRADSRYYIASINKLFMSALILRLAAQGRIGLDDRLADFVPAELISGLHVLGGTDHSGRITLRHLLSQTSGLPDYLEDEQPDGRVAIKDLEAGLDPAWPLAKVVEAVKSMPPHFPPGEPGAARYGDTGHQLLELVVEAVTGASTREALQGAFDELGMADTYVAGEVQDGAAASTGVSDYVPVRFKAKEVGIGRFIGSTGNDIVSTARDQMTFLRAFIEGRFWPQERLGELERWNKVFFPFEYGVGIQRLVLPRAMTLFRRVGPMVGHAGSVGSVAFYSPDKDVYFTGTVNQQAKPSAIYRPLIRALMSLR